MCSSTPVLAGPECSRFYRPAMHQLWNSQVYAKLRMCVVVFIILEEIGTRRSRVGNQERIYLAFFLAFPSTLSYAKLLETVTYLCLFLNERDHHRQSITASWFPWVLFIGQADAPVLNGVPILLLPPKGCVVDFAH